MGDLYRVERPADASRLWSRYAEGYLDAAKKLLVPGLVEYDVIVGDATWPGLYCLRHGLELRLKAIGAAWVGSGRAADTGIDWRNQNRHSLVQTWDDLLALLEHRFETDIKNDPGTMEQARKDLELIDTIDRGGTLFRYPTDQSGQVRDELTTGIDLAELIDAMSRLDDLLRAMHGVVDWHPNDPNF